MEERLRKNYINLLPNIASERQFGWLWPMTRKTTVRREKIHHPQVKLRLMLPKKEWHEISSTLQLLSKWKEAARVASVLSCETPVHLLELTSTMIICLAELHFFICCFEEETCIVDHCYGGKRCSGLVKIQPVLQLSSRKNLQQDSCGSLMLFSEHPDVLNYSVWCRCI